MYIELNEWEFQTFCNIAEFSFISLLLLLLLSVLSLYQKKLTNVVSRSWLRLQLGIWSTLIVHLWLLQISGIYSQFHSNLSFSWSLVHGFVFLVFFFNSTYLSDFQHFFFFDKVISNIGRMVFVKLENHNYLLWKSQFLPVLRANRLDGFVDWLLSCPSEFLVNPDGSISKEVNPGYLVWIQRDQNVLCWINATLSEGILAHIVGLKSPRRFG